jgi:hypothetical protein
MSRSPWMRAAKIKPEAQKDRTVGQEAKRIESLINDLAKKLDDPELPLSATMRLSIRQSELLAYLRGIRFATGEENTPFEVQED